MKYSFPWTYRCFSQRKNKEKEAMCTKECIQKKECKKNELVFSCLIYETIYGILTQTEEM